MRHRTIETAQFKVVDSAGQTYTVIERMNQVNLDNNKDGEWLDGRRSYQLANGRPVHKLITDEYEIVFNDRQTIKATLC